jgi:hypothetical protein
MWMVWMRMVLVCVDGVDEDGVDVDGVDEDGVGVCGWCG